MPVKFLYAADLRLDRPFALGEGSGTFALRARDVAYETTRRLVDCALSRAVDFVFLRGEICDAHCGAKPLLFLMEQTMRLSKAGIPCYFLNEGTALDAGWPAGFPAGAKWLHNVDANILSSNLLFSPASLPVPPPLQGLSHNESGPKGAWLVTLPDSSNSPKSGEFEREFIALDALRWEHCEMDVTSVETEKDLTITWRAVKDGFREREKSPAGRPVLLHLKLTGVMKERSVFYGESFVRAPGTLMKKLNADEITKKNFVLVDSLSDDTSPLPAAKEASAKGANAPEGDFEKEAAFFKSGMDLRVGLFDVLKERGVLKHLLASDAAALLENMTEAEVESILKESCDMAKYGLFKDMEESK